MGGIVAIRVGDPGTIAARDDEMCGAKLPVVPSVLGVVRVIPAARPSRDSDKVNASCIRG